MSAAPPRLPRRPTRLAVLAAGACILSPLPALAQVGGCAPLAPLVLNIVSQAPQVTVDNSLPRSALMAIRAGGQGGEIQAGHQLQGLTNTRFRSTAGMRYASQRQRDGSWCVSLSQLDIRLEYDNPLKVYIANEIPRGSCKYNVVYAHEMTHVRFVYETLARHLPRMRASLPAALSRYVTVRAATQEEGAAYIQQIVRNVSERAFDVVREETKALHASIDTVENYAAESRKCP